MERRKIQKKSSFRKPRSSGPLGRPRHTWKDNIKINLRKVSWEVVD
jgi:hypothetical protein